jgi:hypothetical protein
MWNIGKKSYLQLRTISILKYIPIGLGKVGEHKKLQPKRVYTIQS